MGDQAWERFHRHFFLFREHMLIVRKHHFRRGMTHKLAHGSHVGPVRDALSSYGYCSGAAQAPPLHKHIKTAARPKDKGPENPVPVLSCAVCDGKHSRILPCQGYFTSGQRF